MKIESKRKVLKDGWLSIRYKHNEEYRTWYKQVYTKIYDGKLILAVERGGEGLWTCYVSDYQYNLADYYSCGGFKSLQGAKYHAWKAAERILVNLSDL